MASVSAITEKLGNTVLDVYESAAIIFAALIFGFIRQSNPGFLPSYSIGEYVMLLSIISLFYLFLKTKTSSHTLWRIVFGVLYGFFIALVGSQLSAWIGPRYTANVTQFNLIMLIAMFCLLLGVYAKYFVIDPYSRSYRNVFSEILVEGYLVTIAAVVAPIYFNILKSGGDSIPNLGSPIPGFAIIVLAAVLMRLSAFVWLLPFKIVQKIPVINLFIPKKFKLFGVLFDISGFLGSYLILICGEAILTYRAGSGFTSGNPADAAGVGWAVLSGYVVLILLHSWTVGD